MDDIYPKSINWSEKTNNTEIGDQKDCGSCYVFSSVDSVQTNYTIAEGKKIFLSVGEILGESTIMGNNGCDGGFPSITLEFIKKYGAGYSKSYNGPIGNIIHIYQICDNY